jgi:predicted hotdog family 3-hydroxylacyl-ACP dehydratase
MPDFSADILSLIPQRPPFVMVDKLLSADDENFETTFLIKSGNVLLDNDELTEAGLIENIAQTAAAGAGYLAGIKGESVLGGYIGAINNLEVFALPKTGDILSTTVIITNKVFEVTIISGSVKCNDELLATCEMKIFTNAAK